MEKTVDYYMNLHYTVELEVREKWYRASLKELPACVATVGAAESVEELWRRLKKSQRRYVEAALEVSEDVPEPAAADPFWEDFPEGIGEKEARSMLYSSGVISFPLSVLQEMWLREMEGTRLGGTNQFGGMGKEKPGRDDARVFPRHYGDLCPVALGRSRKVALIGFDGPRTARGYKGVEVLDQPLRTEAALISALTTLEVTTVRDSDFERLRKALLEHVEAHRELGEKKLPEVLDGLPGRWFSDQRRVVGEEAQRLSPKERKNLVGQTWERWEREPRLWSRSLRFMVTLLRYHRPDFDARSLDEQLGLLDQFRKRVNRFLKEHRYLTAFLEYGTPVGLPKAVQNARSQVEAAVLADVEKRRHLDIAAALGLDVDEEEPKVDMSVPLVRNLVEDGRALLDVALGEGGWCRKAEEMKTEAERYRSLSAEERAVEKLAEIMGWHVVDADRFYRSHPETAEFLITPMYS